MTSGQTVKLHYSSVAVHPAKRRCRSITPSSLYTDQSGLVTVTVTTGSSPTIKSVVLDESSLFGTTTTLPLVSSGASQVYTNTVTIPNNILLQGRLRLDGDGGGRQQFDGGNQPVISVVSGHLWTGGAANANWSSAANWAGNLAPDLSGDNLYFGGVVNLLPVEDQGYSVNGLAFNSTAGSFSIGPASGMLTLAGGVTNNSPIPQTINVGIETYVPVTINAATADLIFDQTIDTSYQATNTIDRDRRRAQHGDLGCHYRQRELGHDGEWHQHPAGHQHLHRGTPSLAAAARWPLGQPGNWGRGLMPGNSEQRDPQLQRHQRADGERHNFREWRAERHWSASPTRGPTGRWC